MLLEITAKILREESFWCATRERFLINCIFFRKSSRRVDHIAFNLFYLIKTERIRHEFYEAVALLAKKVYLLRNILVVHQKVSQFCCLVSIATTIEKRKMLLVVRRKLLPEFTSVIDRTRKAVAKKVIRSRPGKAIKRNLRTKRLSVCNREFFMKRNEPGSHYFSTKGQI